MKRLLKYGWIIGASLLGLLQLLYVYIFFIEPRWIRLERVNITSPRLVRCLNGLKIVQISDLHITEMGYREIKLIQLVNKVKPDIILITADLVGKREGLRPLLDILSLLEPRLFTYVIFGDSDGAIEDLKASSVWSKAGVCVIENKAIALDFLNKKDSAFWLIGTTSAEELERLLQGIPRDKPVILLSHSPDIVKEAALRGVDLVLSGHTHGGQVGVDFIRRLFPYSVRSVYIAGFYQVGAALLYVNRGIGSEKELRFLCWPEVTVFSFFPEAAPTLPKALKQDERS